MNNKKALKNQGSRLRKAIKTVWGGVKPEPEQSGMAAQTSIQPEAEKEIMQIPQCIFPWVFLGLGWGKYGVC